MSMIIDMNKDYSRTIPATWRDISAVFAALGDEHRQRILLTFEPGERLNVGQIAEVSTLARSTVSHHLKVLREAGVLISEREGKEIYFRVNKTFLETSFSRVTSYLATYL
ncbi:MAG: winged helix-turn-helix transcriptional regulator [Zoogloea sp.]|nr:MAG: winged helix-turn-helix transcriptional regulator [Zoogloea sp.]